MKDLIINAINNSGFEIVHTCTKDARSAEYSSYEDMNICKRAKDFVRSYGISKLWSHQRKAIETALSGQNICVSTSTSSGKTEIFQMIAIDILQRNPKAKVLAVYSAKALNSQQKDRWIKSGFKIGQIDGSVTNIAARLQTLKDSRVVVMTPDVIHAFLLGRISNKDCMSTITDFIRKVELVIIDEIHLYRGVFGTNSAYLFRRFNNLRRVLRKDCSFPLYITASATLPNPSEHSEIITGVSPFVNIGKNDDGSPTSVTNFIFVKPLPLGTIDKQRPPVSGLTLAIAQHPEFKSITFVEGRQRTGELILAQEKEIIASLSHNQIYPFRAGIEEESREVIMECMKTGNFRGIISTSALEIGIDIDGLNVAIIANTPYDRNSYYQRIGRVGRGNCKESYVIIIHDGSFKSDLLFNEYNFDIDRLLPDLEPSLYLESRDVLYVHASCHSDFDKECCELKACGANGFDGQSHAYFPVSFCQICEDIATHQTTRDYDRYADVEQPHFYYSLRNNSVTYQLARNDSGEPTGEQISREQLLHEAYKGAVRNVTSRINGKLKLYEQEVVRIDKGTHTILVKDVFYKHAFISPESRTFIYPNFNKDRRYFTASCGSAVFYNLELYERVTIFGYHFNNSYRPYDRPFVDTLRTTGVVLFHPVFQAPGVSIGRIARLIFEAFLMLRAFDRNDIKQKSGKLYTPNRVEELEVGDRFIALYDINQLNISSNLIKKETLHGLFLNLLNHLDAFSNSLFKTSLNEPTREAILILCHDILNNSLINENCATVQGVIDVYAEFSEALYCQEYHMLDHDRCEDEEVDEEKLEWVLCKVLVPMKTEIPNQVTYTILDSQNVPQLQVPQEALKPTAASCFRHYDWEKGVYATD